MHYTPIRTHSGSLITPISAKLECNIGTRSKYNHYDPNSSPAQHSSIDSMEQKQQPESQQQSPHYQPLHNINRIGVVTGPWAAIPCANGSLQLGTGHLAASSHIIQTSCSVYISRPGNIATPSLTTLTFTLGTGFSAVKVLSFTLCFTIGAAGLLQYPKRYKHLATGWANGQSTLH